MSEEKPKSSFRNASLVAAGILLSRIAGLIRMRVLAHFLGDSDAGDAFYAAIKIPNFPQNLFGEGVLSASFIPVYANLIAKGDEAQARKVANVILSFLTLIVSSFVVVGIFVTPYLIDIIAPGFHGEKRDLTIHLVQVIFPGTGLLVLSAWCLGILNSHGQFFLSYTAPVLWNFAIIGVLIVYRHDHDQSHLANYAALGLLLGSILQFGVQLPTTLKYVPRLRVDLTLKLDSVRQIIRNFVPVVIGRGVVQLSAYVDNVLASFLPSGAVAALGYAQSIYMLPISLFGMSISAAELPTMSQAYGRHDFFETLRRRVESAFRQIAFLVVPSMVGFLLLGDAIVGLLFQTGQFNEQTSVFVWGVLAGSAVGLLSSTLGRLYSSAFYSLRDTRTPLRFSIVRVILTTLLGYLMGLHLPNWLGVSPEWGTAGLTASAGIAGWVEFLLLRWSLTKKIGAIPISFGFLAKLWAASLGCGILCLGVKTFIPAHHPVLRGVAVLVVFGLLYFPLTALIGIEESGRWLKRLFNRLKRR
jgi:putative peptidoglycan lipid II flippase